MPDEHAPTMHGRAPRYLDNPTDEDYVAAARFALREGNLPLALEQVAAAVTFRPLHQPFLTLCDDVLQRSRQPLELVEFRGNDVFYGLYAVRGRLLARLSRFDEAIDALFAVAAFSPSVPFLAWACTWIERKKAARRMSPDTVARGLLAFGDALRGRALGPGERLNLESALSVASAVQRRFPDHVALLVAQARALRVSAEYAAAQRCLEATTSVSWPIAVEHAALAAAQGDFEQRIRWLTQASALRPSEPAGQCDLGDAWLEQGNTERAAAAYRQALAQGPCPWAMIGLEYSRALEEGSAVRLVEMAVSAKELAWAEALEAELGAYVSQLCDLVDPIVRVVRGARAQAADNPLARLRVRVRAERPLAPTAALAFAQALAQVGSSGTLEVICERKPDPSTSNPQAILPNELRPLVDVATRLAQVPFAWRKWCEQAAEHAVSLGVAPNRALEALVHVPPPAASIDAVLWVHAFQTAVALLVAHAPASSTERAASLLAISSNVDDWSSAAAFLGLRALGNAQPELRPFLVAELRARLPGDSEPLPAAAMALAVAGGSLALGSERAPFFRLRARVRRELAEAEREANSSTPNPSMANAG